MADLKTTNIFGDAYINNKVGIATNAPATRLQIGQLSPTATTDGIQFGDDPGTRIYRSSAGTLTLSGSVAGLTLSASTALYGSYGDWSGESNKIQWHSNNLYIVNRGGGSWLFRNSSAANVFSIAADGGTSAATNINAGTYVYAGTYLQTNGNLIYPSGQSATQTLQVGNASGNAWIAGLSLAPGGNVTVYNNLTVNNDLTVNGNTYLGNANNDTVYVNDTIRIGATDSGDASLFFGEGAVAGSDYGARWYWDSGYTFYWYTRNNGTDTQLFDYVTNDTSYINWRRHFHMQNKEINYNAQIHFNAGTRFVGNTTQYLIFRSDSTSAGGIQIQDGSTNLKGYIGYWDSNGGGILNNSGNWAVRYNFGSTNTGGQLYGDWIVNGNLSATNDTVTGATMTYLTGAYQNTTVYDSAKTQSATPSRGIRAPASSIQFTDSYAIAPYYTYRSTGDWPVPYGIGWGTGGESSGIFQRFASNGYSFGDMIFYTGNDGYGAFSFRRHTWEGTTHFAAGSGELSTELFRVDWAGNLTMLGTLNGSANSATLYANNGSYGSWRIGGTRNGWGGIEFDYNGVSLMMGSDTVGLHQNTNGWLFRVNQGVGYIYKGSWGGGTAATILDSSNYTTQVNGILLRAAGHPGYGDWNTFGNTQQTVNEIYQENFNLGTNTSSTNFPTVRGYSYGTLINFGSNASARAQVYISHAGNDLIFRGGWGTGGWQTWNRCLTDQNQPYAYAMNQYVRTSDVPTFSGVYTTQIGINDSGMDCYINITDANPTFNYETYGGEFLFYGDKDRPSSLLYVGGIDVSRTIIASAISSRDYTRQLFPSGGYFHAGGAQTGALKIRLPANTKSVYPMLSFTCHIYNYSTGTSRTFKMGGHYSNTQWYNVFAYCLSDNVGNLNVRFGYEGTYLCVWIGETNTGWSYPCAFITDFQNGYSAIDGIWMNGWSLSLVTAFDTVTNGPYTPGYFWNNNNDGAGSGLDADLVDGLDVHTARNDNANKIVRTDSNGYIQAGWINTTSGDQGTSAIDRVYASYDGYIRYYSPTNFRTVLDVPTRGGSGASGTWGISVTGNAATATTAAACSGNAATVTNGIYTTSYYTGTPLGKRRYRIHSADSTSLNSSISSLECGFTYGGSGEPTGPFIAFGGLGGAIDYSCQLVGAYSGGGNDFKIRTRNDDSATWNTWRTIVTDGNYTDYTVTKTGTGASGTWGISISGNAATATSATSATTATTATNATVNSGNTSASWYPIVWHSGNTLYSTAGVTLYAGGSYIQTSYFNCSDNVDTGNITYIMAKFGDNYLRSATAAKVAAFISGQTMNINGSSTSCSGNAATCTTANAVAAGSIKAAGLDSSVEFTMTGLTSNSTIKIFPSYVSPYSSFLRMGYDNTGNYEYTIKRDGTTGFLEFYNTQANYTGYYFRINGTGGGLGIAVSPASRLHVNGDGTNPAVRVDNTGVVLAASVGSNGRTFYGWLPISVDGTTRWIRIFS